MRRKHIYILFVGVLVFVSLASCKEEYEPIENRIYISEAAHKNVKKVSINIGEKTQTNFTVRLADKVGQDVHATLTIDESILNEYNEKTLASYSLLPSDKFSFEEEVVIESGKAMAKPTVITINPYEAAEGVKYALPIRVIGDGSVQEEKLGTQYLLLLDKPWTQATPYMGYQGGFKSDDSNPLPMNAFTIEFWLWMESFNYTNQCIIDCATFYIRLGNDNGQIQKDQMQINVFGTNGENNKCFFTNFHFQKQTWTHVAIAYDQSRCYLYINGEKSQDIEVSGIPAALKEITFFNANTKNNHMMGQARLWNKVLTPGEIQENMGGPVSVTPNLIGYWKMDEGTGNTIHDSSGNNKHAEVVTGKIIEWKKEQCFTKKD